MLLRTCVENYLITLFNIYIFIIYKLLMILSNKLNVKQLGHLRQILKQG